MSQNFDNELASFSDYVTLWVQKEEEITCTDNTLKRKRESCILGRFIRFGEFPYFLQRYLTGHGNILQAENYRDTFGNGNSFPEDLSLFFFRKLLELSAVWSDLPTVSSLNLLYLCRRGIRDVCLSVSPSALTWKLNYNVNYIAKYFNCQLSVYFTVRKLFF